MDYEIAINRSKEELLKAYKVNEIIDALKMHGFVIKEAALELETFPWVLEEVCKYKRIIAIAHEEWIKNQQKEMILAAQDDLSFYRSLREINPKLGMQASMYILDKLGSRFGWGVAVTDDSTRNNVRQLNDGIREEYERQNGTTEKSESIEEADKGIL